MLIFYRIIILILIIISPIIILYRIFKNKEHHKRFFEKFAIPSKKKINGKLVWIHGSSVGEILSVMPIIEKLEKRNHIKQILLTSSTLSSSKVFQKFKFKKTIHQFFPIDNDFLVKKFLNYWRPSVALFVESEIWPNFILNIKKRNISLILLNARLTKKSFKKWYKISNYAKYIFSSFDLCLPQNTETQFYLKKLGAKNIKKIGNLKFSEIKKNIKDQSNLKINNFFKNKKILLTAVSTHNTEETFCAKIHKKFLKKNSNLVTIIIPRHIDRCLKIKTEIEEIGLKVHLHSSKNKISNNINVYLVDTFGETKTFLEISKLVFLGGSIVNHGGQNPLEAARFGCKIIHGPNVSNFNEIYYLLSQNNISHKIVNLNSGIKSVKKFQSKKSISKKNIDKLTTIGNKILNENLNEINNYI